MNFNYTVLSPPTPSGFSLVGASSSDNGDVDVNINIPAKLKVNAYSDSSCTSLISGTSTSSFTRSQENLLIYQ